MNRSNARHFRVLRTRIAATALVITLAQTAFAQAPKAGGAMPDEKVSTLPLTIESLGWLEGCWRGTVNQREFREYWLPLRGGMIVGAGHMVMQDKTQDFEYMRIEARSDGVYYIVASSGKPEGSFKLATITEDGNGSEFTFVKGADEFPQRIVYHRGAEGWLYASIEGKANGEERKVTYPMHRIGCESGEPILK
jgi:Domain of unknown function (DUF6265)